MTSVAILLILLPTGLALGYHRYIGARATRHVSIEVACLSLDQIVDIGTKSSTSMVKRAIGRPQPYAAADGAVEWRTQSKGGVMLYRVLPLPDYLGFRVESWATTVTITRMQGSQDLLRRRRRTIPLHQLSENGSSTRIATRSGISPLNSLNASMLILPR